MRDHNEQRNPVEVLVEEYLQQRREGNCPTVAEFANRHPEHADEITKLLPTIAAMERLKGHVRTLNDRPVELRIDKLQQLGDYRIVREIGRGGMGIVYEAEQQSLGRHVAVKVLLRNSLGDSKHLRRFQREARTAASLHHTNIVPVFGVGEQDGLSYYVMQFIRGIGLDHVIGELRRLSLASTTPQPRSAEIGREGDSTRNQARAAAQTLFSVDQPLRDTPNDDPQSGDRGDSHHSPPPPELAEPTAIACAGHADRSTASEGMRAEVTSAFGPVSSSTRDKRDYWRRVARIGVQVADAVHYAHGEGVLHRDIKSANLLLDEHGRAWVTDFGLATAVAQDRLSRSNDIVGTLRYMAPEQLNGRCDARSDIFSLGLTLYELLVTGPAYEEDDPNRLIKCVSKAELIPPRKRCPSIPRDLETIILKATARDPNHRYQTAGELSEDLQRFQDDHVIHARRTGSVERLWRWSRRNPTVAALSAVLLLVGLASFTAISWKWREAEAERLRAERENQRAEANLSLALDSMDEILGSWATSWMAHPTDPEDGEGEDDMAFRIVVSDRMAATLKDALKFYDQFAAQNASNPRLQRDTADAHIRVGEIYQRLGQFAEAETAFRQAARILEQHRSLFPQDANLAAETAATLNQLGDVLSAVGQFRGARTQFLRAQHVLSPTSEQSPQCIYELARTHGNLGNVAWRLWKRDETAANHRKAVALLDQLVKDYPTEADYRLALAHAYLHYSPYAEDRKKYRSACVSILSQLADEYPNVPDYQCELSEALTMANPKLPISEVEPQLRRAVELAGRIVDAYPTIPRYRASCARAARHLAALVRESGRAEEAEPWYAKSVELYQSLHEDFPKIHVYEFFLAKALHEHGDTLRDLNQLTRSRGSLEQAVGHQQSYVASSKRAAFGQGALALQYRSLAETLSQLGEEKEAARATRRADETQAQMKRQFEHWQRRDRPKKQQMTPQEKQPEKHPQSSPRSNPHDCGPLARR